MFLELKMLNSDSFSNFSFLFFLTYVLLPKLSVWPSLYIFFTIFITSILVTKPKFVFLALIFPYTFLPNFQMPTQYFYLDISKSHQTEHIETEVIIHFHLPNYLSQINEYKHTPSTIKHHHETP